MLWPATPLNRSRAAIVQDLYQMAFYRQLDGPIVDGGCHPSPLSDGALAALLSDYAEFLHRAGYPSDAELLSELADRTGPATAPRSA